MEPKAEKNIHAGHRKRVKARFREHGMDNFAEHEVLELLLYYAVPRGDVNPLAHALMERFGTLAGVMDADMEELCRMEGVGENTALLIKLIPQFCRRYMMSRTSVGEVLNSTEKAGAYLIPRFYAKRDESVYMVCLDAKCKVLHCREISQGSVNSASVDVRKVVENALAHNATQVIIAHNHTSGVAIPSREDIETTRRLQSALKAVDIDLVDHIIVADDDFVSLADNGYFR